MCEIDIKNLSANLYKLCRACLNVCNEEFGARNIFSELKEHESSQDLHFVYEILSYVTSIQVSKDDGFPVLICKSCMTQSLIAYKFKKKYENCNNVINKCLQHLCNLKEESEIKLKDILTDFNDTSCIEEILVDANSEATAENKPHIKTINLKDNDDIARRCVKCEGVFTSFNSFNSHSCKRDKAEERKLCPICGKDISKGYFKNHMYTHSGRSDFVCPICNKAYRSAMSLKFHIAKHTGEKPYLCSLCGKRFIQPTAFKYHMRFHNNERRYSCNYCNKTFVIQSHLVEHERAHTGLKPYVCYICSRKFTRKVDLRLHIFLHIGEKPLSCKFCDKKFSRSAHLKLHEMIHTGKRPYKCEYCGKGFIQRHPLTLHIQTKHRAKIIS